ncbi:MAG: hypothetical protein KQH67_00545 [Bacteroidetes bacterium]|nr:hypothetical protein [Bacteroidota bacterium]
MKTKFTYLLGAGASAEAIPVVKKFKERADQFKVELDDFTTKEFSSLDYLSDFGLKFTEYVNESENFSTIDTLAKYYFLKDRQKFEELKRLLSLYFTFEQLLFEKFDYRYLVFLTTILKQSSFFPDNIKIITWNYDFQFELAGMHFSKDTFNTDGHGNEVKSVPLMEYYPTLGTDIIPAAEEIDILHLNGIAGFFFDTKGKFNFSAFHNMEKEIVGNFISNVVNLNRSHNSLLSFAWEGGQAGFRNRIELAKEIAQETTHLVIIGYSFPFFNREIDKEIMSALVQTPYIQKIYYQDPEKDGQFLYNQFDIDKKIEIVHISDKKQFHIPIEL